MMLKVIKEYCSHSNNDPQKSQMIYYAWAHQRAEIIMQSSNLNSKEEQAFSKKDWMHKLFSLW